MSNKLKNPERPASGTQHPVPGTPYPATRTRPLIVPVFLPHAGCPHRCAFCNQAAVTQVSQLALSPEKLQSKIVEFLNFNRKARHPVQIAFFGGNFLGLKENDIIPLLGEAEKFVTAGKVDSIRISTRPDTIHEERLNILKKYTVSTIELGVQSMDNRVLATAKRGHTASDTERAVTLLKERNYEVGLQMMVGLPGDNETKSTTTGRRIADLRPDFVRIYPTVVLSDSLLAQWYAEGKYTPLTLEACVTLVKKLYLLFKGEQIPVIRMGLQASEELEKGATVLAGPYHPAFGHMVHSEIFLDMAISILESEKPLNGGILIKVHPLSISKMRGLKNKNIETLKHRFQIQSLEVVPDPSLAEDRLIISSAA
ncbi:elongator complex protein 3 [Thermodesulfobacteriota bacterium]